MSRSSCSEICIDIHLVDDADDCGVDWRALFPECLSCRATFEHDQDLLMHASACAVHGEQRRPARCVVEVQRLDQQEFRTLELAVLLSGDNSSDDPCDLHDLRLVTDNFRLATCDYPTSQ